MAISFSRPDPSSPAAVADASFGTARRGFDQQEVRDLLRMVAAELARLQERERFLERELLAAQTRHADAPAELDDETVTRLLGEETTRILQTARESATTIRAKAEDSAARLLREASDEAQRQREEADLESARRRNDAIADAEAELSMAKQQGREMVEEARAYRERVLGELARRRELARQQIEQVIHGRDRLLQAFERARLAAVDVVAELSPLGEPEEYVDLTPTTGPIPVMVPASLLEARPDTSAGDEQPSTEDAVVGEDAVLAEGGVVTMVVEVGEIDATTGADTTSEAAPAAIYDVAGEANEAGDATGGDAGGSEDAATPAGVAAPVVALVPELADDDDLTAADVDDLFARLRAESAPQEETADDPDDIANAPSEAPDDETPFQQRDAVLVPLIVASARKLKRALADEQNEVLDTLRRTEPVRDVDAVVPADAEHVDRYADAISAELLAATTAGMSAIAGGTAPDAVDVGPDGVLAPVRESLASGLVAPLRDRLDNCIGDGDGDNDAIAKRVRAVYREWKTKRIDDQLDDLLRMAHGRGVSAALAPGTPIVWTLDPDHPACPDCEDNSLSGAVGAGDAFPTGHTAAPAHPGCRCLLAIST